MNSRLRRKAPPLDMRSISRSVDDSYGILGVLMSYVMYLDTLLMSIWDSIEMFNNDNLHCMSILEMATEFLSAVRVCPSVSVFFWGVASTYVCHTDR